MQQLDNGYYGKGFYLTSFIEYAIYYIKFSKTSPDKKGYYSVLACYVNTGKIYDIDELHKGKPIPKGYDCNRIKEVIGYQGEQFGLPKKKTQIAPKLMMNGSSENLPEFYHNMSSLLKALLVVLFGVIKTLIIMKIQQH